MVRPTLLLAAPLLLGSCTSNAQRYLRIDGAHLERGQGISVTNGGVEVGHSVLVAGTLTNTHPTKTARWIHLEVQLFRTAGDKKPARVYDERGIKGLEEVAPGQRVDFEHYVKSSLAGYEACKVTPSEATFE